jgi:nitric oxide reductase subunit C
MSLRTKRLVFFTLVSAYLLYTLFVYTKGTSTESPISGEAIEGRQLFREKNCISCHQLYGLGGYMGPDLTNVISAKGEIYVRSFLENGTEKMPDFDLKENQVKSMIAYLTYVDSTSFYPVRNFELTWYGTVNANPIKK